MANRIKAPVPQGIEHRAGWQTRPAARRHSGDLPCGEHGLVASNWGQVVGLLQACYMLQACSLQASGSGLLLCYCYCCCMLQPQQLQQRRCGRRLAQQHQYRTRVRGGETGLGVRARCLFFPKKRRCSCAASQSLIACCGGNAARVFASGFGLMR
jgi:hypothetical protein